MQRQPVRIRLPKKILELLNSRKDEEVQFRPLIESLIEECDESRILEFFSNRAPVSFYKKSLRGCARFSCRITDELREKLNGMTDQCNITNSILITHLISSKLQGVYEDGIREEAIRAAILSEIEEMNKPFKRVQSLWGELLTLYNNEEESPYYNEFLGFIDGFHQISGWR